MLRVASLIWMVLGTSLGGTGVIAIVSTPSLAEHAAILIPATFLTAVVIAMPLSYLIAKRIQDGSRKG